MISELIALHSVLLSFLTATKYFAGTRIESERTYNRGQNKMEQQTHIPRKPRESQKTPFSYFCCCCCCFFFWGGGEGGYLNLPSILFVAGSATRNSVGEIFELLRMVKERIGLHSINYFERHRGRF